MQKRKTPLRKCVGCQGMYPKKQLLRIVRTPETEVRLDLTGKMSGRGAYFCGRPACLAQMQKRKALDRALNVKIEPVLYVELAEYARKQGAAES